MKDIAKEHSRRGELRMSSASDESPSTLPLDITKDFLVKVGTPVILRPILREEEVEVSYRIEQT